MIVLEKRIEKLLNKDNNVNKDGSYMIRSAYFDTPNNKCYYENENGVEPRKKYRIRIYNCDDSYIILECKSKIKNMTHKKSCKISKEMCTDLLNGKIPNIEKGMKVKLIEMLTDMKLKNMRPVIIVQYERKPFIYKVGNVRITLDTNISSSKSFDKFFESNIPRRQILANNQGVLEVKWDELLPSYIKSQIELEKLQWTNFSKYYLCRKYNNYGGMIK